MKIKQIFIMTLAAGAFMGARAQESWSIDRCIDYAIANSTGVKKAQLSQSTRKAEYLEAIGSFLPGISASSSVQWNWGRNIDPETNTYNTVTTFNNGYGLYASLTLFDGMRTLNNFKQARESKKYGSSAIQNARDEKAIEVMMAYVEMEYCKGTIEVAQDKLAESKRALEKAELEYELGTLSMPDLAQRRAQQANDEYALTQRQNAYQMACLSLWDAMNLAPELRSYDDFVGNADALPEPTYELDDPEQIYQYALGHNPKAQMADINVKMQKYGYRMAKGNYMPTISAQAGLSTNYFKALNGEYQAASFGEQFRNNLGKYVGASISIPLFDGFGRHSSVKRAGNNYRIAQLERDEAQMKLYNDITAAVNDRDGYFKELLSLEKKMEADSLAYALAKRKCDEGMLSIIDLLTTANTYYQSRVDLLQRRMLYYLKNRLVEYYKGEGF
ncbi:MAG: TolC family protein [Lachnospiraceae bacterium]|nr:TolC family protein [Lachnospiraceae bacterium]